MMKFLLFLVSIIFSIIFYIFYWLSVWKDIFWNNISNSFELHSFSWNLLIESFIFLFIGILFLYFFSDMKEKWTNKLSSYKIEILYFIFYTIFMYCIYFYNNTLNFYIITISILFILSDLLFNHISNIPSLNKYKINLKYFWIILNYIVSIVAIIYIYNIWNSLILFLILGFNVVFNILIHKNYTNYISLLISTLIILFLFYSLYFLLFELYILYI